MRAINLTLMHVVGEKLHPKVFDAVSVSISQVLYDISRMQWYCEWRFHFTYQDMPATQIPTASSSSECCDTETRVFATIAPLAATAGTPIPGKVESPQQKSWGIGVACPGKVPSPAFMAGP